MSDLLKLNVNDHTERKNGLTYLSWAWAWAEVLKIDPQAEWQAVEYQQPDGTTLPCMYIGEGSAMVKTAVTIKGKTRSCMLPVMDHRNKAIKNPDAFAINTAIMRCMTKAISMHGLGLYIYAGEDLPEGEEPPAEDITKHGTLKHTPTDEAIRLSSERETIIKLAASAAVVKFKKGDQIGSYEEVSGITDADEKLYLWQILKPESALRSFIKKHAQELRETEAEPT
jgi:hypothetical protein